MRLAALTMWGTGPGTSNSGNHEGVNRMPEMGAMNVGLREYIRVALRRKWVILPAIVIVPVGAFLLSLGQEPRYEASSSVLINHQNLGLALTQTPGSSVSIPAERIAQTQADLAALPQVAERVLRSLGLDDRSATDLIDATRISPKANSDLLSFSVEDGDPELATRLATSYAEEFVEYRREFDTAALRRAREEVRASIDESDDRGERGTAIYNSLVEKEQQLRTLEALQSAPVALVREAGDAAQVQPRPLRNAALGLVLGLVLGGLLGALREALDTRVRSAEEVGERLGLPLLARIPEPPRRLRAADRLVMIEAPGTMEAESLRVLRTNLEFVNLNREARSVMVTSAVEREGKSTTVANLAVGLALARRRVILVDLDLRRPYIDRFFDLGAKPGLTDVALGHVDLDAALATIPLAEADSAYPHRNGSAPGILHVLPSGPIPPDPGEFIGSRALQDILMELRERADIVLVDSPPLLHVGDALVLSGIVDGIILVTRLNLVSRTSLREVARIISASPGRPLGYVVTDADGQGGYGGGYHYEYSVKRDAQRREGVASGESVS